MTYFSLLEWSVGCSKHEANYIDMLKVPQPYFAIVNEMLIMS